ncbi:hypothetical protein EG68_04431 [Paragonimus skrjabini miyazakii]|uniref:Uncharacterized protein n=1 Tax=Paragonimus skrjabini miyazakii TaxID=59628 RepID=A0A8S9Z3P5_9TREM|nr:hypothetical protein EG68_04431 [Paragonimus skrjabini miyazakii]
MSGGHQCLNKVPADEPWYERVHNTKTLSSTRRYINYRDPQAPADDLDLRLSAIYDNHKEFNKELHDAVFQSESLRPLDQEEIRTLKLTNAKTLPPYRCIGDHGRILVNRMKPIERSHDKSNATVFRSWENPTKDSIHKADNSICKHRRR